MEFEYDQEKNELLFKERGVTFIDVIEVISEEGILLDFKHPNKQKYPDQRILVIKINNYPYCIPYMKNGEKLFLKTIFPARKFKYLIED
jgi:uncharacterized DUF497 family protein